MLFNSFEFLIFLPLTFLLYWFVFKGLKIQNLFIVAASYFFYGCWDWRFLFLIFLTTLLCFISGWVIGVTENRNIKRWSCGLNIAINIAILGFFKYFNFFSENLKLLFEQFGYQLDWFTLDVLLPVGISFYTFQAISYPIDVYREKINHTKDFISFTAFISFFPQLVAGPIERSTQLLPQFQIKRSFDYDKSVAGMRQILWGFFKKIVIADNCAMFANIIFEDYSHYSSPLLWLGAFFFTFQIYGDFSGYSDIAIGTARLFGISLSRNFHYPYFSRNIAEFWQRWHISLNTWFRDYIYIPLGGNRVSKIKVVRNTMIIFLLSGLWHGANWTFIVWGAYHGLLFLPRIILGKKKRNFEFNSIKRGVIEINEIFSILVTFIIVMIGWIIFRSNSLDEVFHYLWRCVTAFPTVYDYEIFRLGGKALLVSTLLMIGILLFTDWTQRHKSFGLQFVEGKSIIFRWGSYISIIFLILIFAGQQEQFIYFQF